MNLNEYLEDLGMTKSNFARRLGCNISYITDVINGRREPSWQLAKHIELLTQGKVKADSLYVQKNTNNQKKNKKEKRSKKS